jgi:hypothetical protein
MCPSNSKILNINKISSEHKAGTSFTCVVQPIDEFGNEHDDGASELRVFFSGKCNLAYPIHRTHLGENVATCMLQKAGNYMIYLIRTTDDAFTELESLAPIGNVAIVPGSNLHCRYLTLLLTLIFCVGEVDPDKSYIGGDVVCQPPIVGSSVGFYVELKDAYRNPVDELEIPFSLMKASMLKNDRGAGSFCREVPLNLKPKLHQHSAGRIHGAFVLAEKGVYKLVVTLGGADVNGSPLALRAGAGGCSHIRSCGMV